MPLPRITVITDYSYYRLQLAKLRNDKAVIICKEYFILYIYI